jgi:hypothetical protein
MASTFQKANAVHALIARGADVSEALLLVATGNANENESLAAIRTLAATGADVKLSSWTVQSRPTARLP